jgi:hypothetical protein
MHATTLYTQRPTPKMLHKVGLTVKQVVACTDMEETSNFKIRKQIALVKENSILWDVSIDDYKLARENRKSGRTLPMSLQWTKVSNYDCLTSVFTSFKCECCCK